MNDEEHVFYLLRGIPRNDDWQFFLELMMDKNATATLTPDEIAIKLVEKEATIKCENGLGQEALLFAIGNSKGNARGKGKGRKSWKGDESDEDQDCKGKPTCFHCHKEGNKVWNCQGMKRGEPPVTKDSTETAAKAKDDIITAARDSAEMTRIIENYLGDRYRRINGAFEGEFVVGLCLHLSHLWRSKEVCSVYGIHQEG